MLSISRTDLPTYLIEKLRACGYKNANDIITTSPLLLMSQNFNNSEIQLISNAISKRLTPKCHTALELFIFENDTGDVQHLKHISTGCSVLDDVLNGGIDVRSITEIVGVSGVGKTQFCFNCCVETVLAKSGSVIFIDTELKFDPLRLSNLLEHRIAQDGVLKIGITAERLLDKVKVNRPKNCEELLSIVDNLEAVVMSERVSLVVIDSIAALARKENLNEDDKENFIIRQSAMLKKIADLCNCCILVTNQIAATSQEYDTVYPNLFNDRIYDISKRVFHPALGPTWFHCVDTRFVLEKRTKLFQRDEFEGGLHLDTNASVHSNKLLFDFDRILSIVKSPRVGFVQLMYEIQSSGIFARTV